MKNRTIFRKGKALLTVWLFLIIFSNCDESTKPEEPAAKSVARTEIETITEFLAVKQSVTYDVLKTFSHDYTTKLFTGEDLTHAEIDNIFAKISSLAEYEESVLAASGQLLSKTSLQKAGNVKSVKGLGDALKGFFTWVSGSGKRSRDRIRTITSNMNESERSKLYNNLRSTWKKETKSETDFWNKLDNGEFDNKASQMYNDFYHDAETDFPFLAHEKGLTIQKITHKEGAEGVEKGSKLMIETVKTVTPLGKGMDMVEKADEYAGKVKKLYNDPTNAIKDEVKSALADKIGSFVDIDGAVNSNLIGENVGKAIKFVSDYTMGSDDPSDWVKKAMDLGLGKLLDSDNKGSKADIVLAENKNPNAEGPSIVISVDPKDDDGDAEDVIDILLPNGDWIFTTFDEEGNNDKVEIHIDNGVGTIVVVSTDPEGEHNKGQYALSVWASPSDPGPGEGVTVSARVNPAVAGINVFFSISGTDGYDDEETSPTDGQGLVTFYIPGGSEGVHDAVVIRIVETGLTRTINYTF